MKPLNEVVRHEIAQVEQARRLTGERIGKVVKNGQPISQKTRYEQPRFALFAQGQRDLKLL